MVVEAVGLDTMIVRLIRDRDEIYGAAFNARVNNLGVQQTKVCPEVAVAVEKRLSERFISTLRRELLDHVIVLSERRLFRLVRLHTS